MNNNSELINSPPQIKNMGTPNQILASGSAFISGGDSLPLQSANSASFKNEEKLNFNFNQKKTDGPGTILVTGSEIDEKYSEKGG